MGFGLSLYASRWRSRPADLGTRCAALFELLSVLQVLRILGAFLRGRARSRSGGSGRCGVALEVFELLPALVDVPAVGFEALVSTWCSRGASPGVAQLLGRLRSGLVAVLRSEVTARVLVRLLGAAATEDGRVDRGHASLVDGRIVALPTGGVRFYDRGLLVVLEARDVGDRGLVLALERSNTNAGVCGGDPGVPFLPVRGGELPFADSRRVDALPGGEAFGAHLQGDAGGG